MPKFQVGDRVEIIESPRLREWDNWQDTIGLSFILTPKHIEWLRNNNGTTPLGDNRFRINFPIESFKKLGGPMSKYDELKQRIEAVKGWDKEADDILATIFSNFQATFYFLVIPAWKVSNEDAIRIYDVDEEEVISFYFTNQSSKFAAFKKALLWLLDHSDIKKDDKSEEITKLKQEAADLQRRIERLEA
jgi:hypothetical protein